MYFENASLSPPLAESMRGFFFSDIYCEKLVKFLEINITMLWGPPYSWILLGFLNCQNCAYWTFNNSSLVHVEGFCQESLLW